MAHFETLCVLCAASVISVNRFSDYLHNVSYDFSSER